MQSANLIFLGDFTDELEFQNQEVVIDSVLQSCEVFAVTVPRTFLQAVCSADADKWKVEMAEELDNLDRMKVWIIWKVSTRKKPMVGGNVILPLNQRHPLVNNKKPDLSQKVSLKQPVRTTT